MTDFNIQKLFRAIRFAVCAHAGQTRKDDGRPYADHVLEVGQILHRAGCTETTVIAGVLHDVLEDTTAQKAELQREFGEGVLVLVKYVTDDPNKSKGEQKRAQLGVFRRRSLPDKALEIKLADAISNCRTLAQSPPVDWSRAKVLGYIAFKAQFAKELVKYRQAVSPQATLLAVELLRIVLASEKEIHELGFTFETLAENYLLAREGKVAHGEKSD